MSAPSMNAVLAALIEEGRLDASGAARAAEALASPATATPWYLRILAGFGGWLAALFLTGFFLVTLFLSESGMPSLSDLLPFGILLLGGAILLRREQRGTFSNQLALAASLTGQVLVVLGVQPIGVEGSALLVLLMQVLLIVFYVDQTHRVLSTLIAVFAIQMLFLASIWWWPENLVLASDGALVLLPVFALPGVLGIVSTRLWLRESACASPGPARLLRPIAYGLVIGLFGLLLPSAYPFHYGWPGGMFFWGPMWPSAILLGAGLLYLVHTLLKERGLPPFGAFALSAYGAVLLLLLPALRAPGLIAALTVLLLGFRRGNRLLMGIALVFLAVFLSAYYYSLSLSLLLKSVALVGSGAVLLGLRWVIFKQLSKREALDAH